MNDLRRFKGLLTVTGVPFKVEEKEDETSLIISEAVAGYENSLVTGYSGFFTEIIFDKNGKLIQWGAWE